jgi:hypothetical protein
VQYEPRKPQRLGAETREAEREALAEIEDTAGDTKRRGREHQDNRTCFDRIWSPNNLIRGR